MVSILYKSTKNKALARDSRSLHFGDLPSECLFLHGYLWIHRRVPSDRKMPSLHGLFCNPPPSPRPPAQHFLLNNTAWESFLLSTNGDLQHPF